MAVSIMIGCIVWIRGPFRCGSFSDLRILRTKLKSMLQENETVIADRGYKDEKCKHLLSDTTYYRRLYSVNRARHEIVNRRFK